MKLYIANLGSTLPKSLTSGLRAVLLLLYLFLTIPAHAIHDTNQNGVSDPWERKNNNGNLIVDFDPTADPDGDGWTNEQEAVTGTNPFDGNAPGGFLRPEIEHIPAVYITPEVEGGEPEILSPETTTITWPTLAGKLYTLFASTDLSPGSWSRLGNPRIGSGAEMGYGIPLTQLGGGIPDKLFLRVSVLDIDQDSDTLTDAEEAELGSSPYSADGDHDGLSDLAELFTYQTNPVSSDTDGDGVSDPDEILINFTNPRTATDADGDGIPDDLEKDLAKQFLAFQPNPVAWGIYYIGLAAGNLDSNHDYTGDGVSVGNIASVLTGDFYANQLANSSPYLLEPQERRSSFYGSYRPASQGQAAFIQGGISLSLTCDTTTVIKANRLEDFSYNFLNQNFESAVWCPYGSAVPLDSPDSIWANIGGANWSCANYQDYPTTDGSKTPYGTFIQTRFRLFSKKISHADYERPLLKVTSRSPALVDGTSLNTTFSAEIMRFSLKNGRFYSNWAETQTTMTDSQSAYALLRTVDLAVDADRDREITFDGKDKTTAGKPFRFWINNDQDDVEVDEPIIVDVNDRDLLDSTIKTSRDLEDLTRIEMNVGIPLELLQEGKFTIGLKIKESTPASPAIRIWPNESDTGSRDYLTDAAAAGRQRSKTLIGDTLNGTTFIPKSYWLGRSDSHANLIFEGVKKGEGELILVVKSAGASAEIEAASIYLNLLDVREMYQRARIVNEPEAIPHPWDNPNPPAQAWAWDPWSWPYSEDPAAKPITAVMVHGWRMKYMDFMNWSDTSYKRLWHQGFKGKFYSFRWATFSGDNNGLPYGLDEELEEHSGTVTIPPGGLTYNASEYRAWLCGPALASFVNQLPNPGKRSLFAHSMGNVISGAALRSGMSVQLYAMCNAAVAAMAYDPTRIHQDYIDYETPDTDHDPAIRNGYGMANRFNLTNMPEVFNFCLPADEALKGWRSNNEFFKADRYYSYSEYPLINHYKLNYVISENIYRNVTGLSEAMGYVTQSRSLPAGADPATAGSVNNTPVNMTTWGFGKTHSAVWRWSNQKSHLFWGKLVEKLKLSPKN